MERKAIRRERIVVAALALVATYAFFFDYLPPAKRVSLYSDVAGYHYPLQWFAFDSLKEGRIPQWDPSIYCGISFVGNIQAALLYPLAWLMYAVVWTMPRIPFTALEAFAFFHVWLAFLLCYLWLRGRTAKLASTLGASVFAFTGYMFGAFWHLGMMCSITWIPLGLWGVDEAAERRDWRPLWKVALASAMAFLAGYPACWIVFCVTILVYALGSRAHWRAAVGACLALAASALLFMAQLLPAMEARSLMVLEPKYGPGAWGWKQLLAYLIPNWFDFNPGHPAEFESGCVYLYLGLPALFAIGWIAGRRRLRPYGQALAGIAAALVLANPPAILIRAVERFPALDDTMTPFNFYAGVAAMAALLTALGLDDFFKSGSADSRRSLPRWAAFAAMTALVAWSCRQLWIGDHGGIFAIRWGALAGTVVALGVFSFGAWAVRQAAGKRRALLAAMLLASVWVDYRVFGGVRQFNSQRGDEDAYHVPYGIAGVDDDAYRAMRENRSFRVISDGPSGTPPDEFRFWGLATPQGWDPFLSVQYKAAIQRWVPFQDNRNFYTDVRNDAMLQALGVRYVLAHEGQSNESWMAASPKFRLVGRKAMFFRVYEYLLAKPPYGWEDARNGSVDVVGWLPERRVFFARSQQSGRFVLVEQHFPGWAATVDGHPVEIERWGGAFQSIRVPAGDHWIQFEFRSAGFQVGAAISLAAACALAMVAMADRRSRRRAEAIVA